MLETYDAFVASGGTPPTVEAHIPVRVGQSQCACGSSDLVGLDLYITQDVAYNDMRQGAHYAQYESVILCGDCYATHTVIVGRWWADKPEPTLYNARHHAGVSSIKPHIGTAPSPSACGMAWDDQPPCPRWVYAAGDLCKPCQAKLGV